MLYFYYSFVYNMYCKLNFICKNVFLYVTYRVLTILLLMKKCIIHFLLRLFSVVHWIWLASPPDIYLSGIPGFFGPLFPKKSVWPKFKKIEKSGDLYSFISDFPSQPNSVPVLFYRKAKLEILKVKTESSSQLSPHNTHLLPPPDSAPAGATLPCGRPVSWRIFGSRAR